MTALLERRPRAVRTGGVVLAGTLLLGVGAIGIANAQTSPGSEPSAIVTVTPFRILDTRDGVGAGGVAGPVEAGEEITVQIAGVGGIPADATGAVLNITATEATAPSFVSAWPTGAARPNSSILNFVPDQTVANMVTVALGASGQLHLFNFAGTVHLVADVAGYLQPTRGGGVGAEELLDPRFGSPPGTAVAGSGRECTLGEVILQAGSVANGVPAAGQILPISQNTALFALLGTTYGGNGQTTFALPDLRDSAPNGLTYSICMQGIFPSRT